MHHAIVEIGGKDLSWLRAISNKADRSPRLVGVGAQLLLEREQVCLRVQFEGQGIYRVAFIAAALAKVPPQISKRIEVGADHEPRTGRTKLLNVLPLLNTLPKPKKTTNARDGPNLVV